MVSESGRVYEMNSVFFASIVVSAILPDGPSHTLLEIRHFDEKWHDTYRFAQRVRLPQGTRLVARFVYDNSATNVRNPHHPPQRVVYGSNANDEMSDVFLQVIPVDELQYAVLEEHQRRAELRSKIIGYRKTLEVCFRHGRGGLSLHILAHDQEMRAMMVVLKSFPLHAWHWQPFVCDPPNGAHVVAKL